MVWSYDEPGGLDERATKILLEGGVALPSKKQVRGVARGLKALIDEMSGDLAEVARAWYERDRRAAQGAEGGVTLFAEDGGALSRGDALWLAIERARARMKVSCSPPDPACGRTTPGDAEIAALTTARRPEIDMTVRLVDVGHDAPAVEVTTHSPGDDRDEELNEFERADASEAVRGLFVCLFEGMGFEKSGEQVRLRVYAEKGPGETDGAEASAATAEARPS